MKNIIVLAFSIFISIFSSVALTAKSESGMVTVRGAPSCGDWVAESQNDDKGQITNNRAWLIGFLSGLVIGSSKDSLIGTDNNSLYLWMDNYCKSHPLEAVSDGGTELFIELMHKKGLK